MKSGKKKKKKKNISVLYHVSNSTIRWLIFLILTIIKNNMIKIYTKRQSILDKFSS